MIRRRPAAKPSCRNLHWLAVCFYLILGTLLPLGCGGSSDALDELSSFFRDPNTEPVRATIKTAVPLAHIAAVSMAAVQDNPPPQVISYDTCSVYPCLALITMELDPANLPFAYPAGGTVLVAGLWASPNQAILTASFIDVQPGVPFFKVSKVSTFPVMATTTPVSGLKIVYADIDIDISSEPDDTIDLTNAEIQAEYDRLQASVSGDPEINISMDAWVIQMADDGTATDFTDDSYSISGGGQYIDINSTSSPDSAGIFQVGMVDVRVSPVCSRNPTDGLAFIQEAGSGGSGSFPVLASALMEFDSTCNGAVRVLVGLGNYINATGSWVTLDLDAP